MKDGAMKTTVEKTDAVKYYTDLFGQNQKLLTTGEAEFISAFREKGIENFRRQGFPARKDENYTYIYLEPFFTAGLTERLKPRNLEFNLEDMFRCDIPTLDTHVLLVLNGFFHPTDGKKLVTMNNGVIFGSLAEAISAYPEIVKKHLGKYAEMENNPFVSLNSAFAKDGIFLYVPDNRM